MTVIETSLLPALLALLETQSVSDAAARLHVGQPAMSRTLARLREITGDPLLLRVGRGLERTARADALLPLARDAMAAAERALARVQPFEPATARGLVNLALSDEMQAIAADTILLELRRRAPGLDVRLHPLNHQTAEQGRRGRIDLAVTPRLPANQLPDLSDFVLKPLYERRFVTVSQRRRALSLDAFCAADHVLVSLAGDDHGFVDDALRQVGRTRRVAVTVQSFATAVQLVRSSKTLVSTLPHDVVHVLAPRLHVQRCPVATPTYTMCLVWHSSLTGDPRSRFLRSVLLDVLRGPR